MDPNPTGTQAIESQELDENEALRDEGRAVGAYASCDEYTMENLVSRHFSYDSDSECYIECHKGTQEQCYGLSDECYDWNSNKECIEYRTQAIPNTPTDNWVRYSMHSGKQLYVGIACC